MKSLMFLCLLTCACVEEADDELSSTDATLTDAAPDASCPEGAEAILAFEAVGTGPSRDTFHSWPLWFLEGEARVDVVMQHLGGWDQPQCNCPVFDHLEAMISGDEIQVAAVNRLTSAGCGATAVVHAQTLELSHLEAGRWTLVSGDVRRDLEIDAPLPITERVVGFERHEPDARYGSDYVCEEAPLVFAAGDAVAVDAISVNFGAAGDCTDADQPDRPRCCPVFDDLDLEVTGDELRVTARGFMTHGVCGGMETHDPHPLDLGDLPPGTWRLVSDGATRGLVIE